MSTSNRIARNLVSSTCRRPTSFCTARSLSPQTSGRRSSQLFACDRNWASTLQRKSISQFRKSKESLSQVDQRFPRRRKFSATAIASHGHLGKPKPGEEREVTFIDKEGDSHTFEVADGDNLLDIAQANDLEMEGACGGSCACSTCHVIVEDENLYDAIAEPDDDENDMLDLAFGLTETSRLGCQVKMSKALDGLVVKLPSMTRNLQASDFVEKK